MAEITDAFQMLSSGRSNTGFSMNPLSFSDIGMYLAVFGIPWCGKDTFVRLIKRLDSQFLTKVNKRDD